MPLVKRSCIIITGLIGRDTPAEGGSPWDAPQVRRAARGCAAVLFFLETHHVSVRAPFCISNPLRRLRKLMPITDCGSFSITAA